MKVLYITDLDGTLLNRDSKLSNYTIETINQLIEKGMLFTYATARSMYSALPVVQGLDIRLPVIIYNGSMIKSGNDITASHFFNAHQLEHLYRLFDYFRLFPFVYTMINQVEKVFYHKQYLNEGMEYYLSQRTNDPRFNKVDQRADMFQGEIFYFTLIDQRERLLGIYNELKNDPQYKVIFQQELYREEYWLEIVPSGVSKANAIKELKQILEVDKIVCFGDAMNDIEMFDVADECYAVNNAVDQLKEKATRVILGNNQDGVAKWLLKHAEFDGGKV